MTAAVPGPCGLAVIDKPQTWTSHDVVAKCRGILGTRKVGHSGTLDPMATGVLVMGVGPATRLLTFLTGLPKTYEATIQFGSETDSLDADGVTVQEHPEMGARSVAEVQSAADALTGDLLQIPPMVSAIKVDGRRLYELAHAGETVERQPRPVTVTRFEVAATRDPMVFTASIDCSSGTYVRVLASDLGQALRGGAHLSGLRRTAVGPFDIAEATSIDDIALLAPATIDRVLASVVIDEEIAIDVGHGRPMERDRLGVPTDDAGPWAVLDVEKRLLAVYQPHRDSLVKPAAVFPP